MSAIPQPWHQELAALMRRPQPVTLPMIVLFAIVPFYLVIGEVLIPGRTLHAPAIALDAMMPLAPDWSVMYGSLFCAALLPVFVVHQQELVRRTILAFLMTWLVAYACFIGYPTVGPRPAAVSGDGFFTWALKVIYSSDHRFNCLPSLHVAQCCLAALACSRVHRGVGAACLVWAFLVGVSTVYTKQHYVLDVVTGALLAGFSYLVFLRGFPRDAVPRRERQLAPTLALCAFGVYGLMLFIIWLAYVL